MQLKIKLAAAALMAYVFAIPGKSQELKISEMTSKYVAESVVLIDSIKKDTLFKRAYKWLYTTYPNTGEKGTYINAAKSKIVAHEYFSPDPEGLWDYTNLRIGFILTCECKDRKFKYSFTDFYYYSTGEGKVPFDSEKFKNYDVLIRDVMLKKTNEYVKNSINELVIYLQKYKTKGER